MEDAKERRPAITFSPQKLTLLALAAAALAYPWMFTLPFERRFMIVVLLYAMLAQAWNILGGYTGQVSLGHVVFFGIGAYTSTLLHLKLGLTPWIGMIAGGVAATLVSQVIGYPSFRLKGHYFVIATIVLAEIVHVLFRNWDWAGGALGLSIPPRPESFANFQFFTTKLPYYYISLALLAIVLATTAYLERSKAGYYFRAIKEDPDAARGLGVKLNNHKMLAMAISAFFTGVGGAFYAQFVLYIDPDNVFGFKVSVLIMLVAVVGGIGTLWGPVLGAFILIPLSEFTRVLLGGAGRALDLLVYGILIMLVAVFEPRGLWALGGRIKTWRRGK